MVDNLPPPAVLSTPVIEYAIVGDLPIVRRTWIFIDGVELGSVPLLAICGPVPAGGVDLVHCDAEWNMLATRPCSGVADAKSKSERLYPGLEWLASPHDKETVQTYLENEWAGLECSFCRRTPLHFEKLISGPNGVNICNDCVRQFHSDMAT